MIAAIWAPLFSNTALEEQDARAEFEALPEALFNLMLSVASFSRKTGERADSWALITRI